MVGFPGAHAEVGFRVQGLGCRDLPVVCGEGSNIAVFKTFSKADHSSSVFPANHQWV